MRAALFEVCEIVALVNHKEATRDAARQVQRELLRLTKGKNNLLAHELPKAKVNVEPEDHPLLLHIDG